jgi:hypothetical protein
MRAKLPAPVGVFTWQILTGLGLLGLFVHQWIVVIRKWTGVRRRGDASKFWHIVVGLGMLVAFVLHAPRIGHAGSLALAAVFLANSALGMTHFLVMRARSQRLFLTWTFLHYGLSLVMIPLIVIHIWAAIAFK